jgi:hypothetical protein
MKNPVKMLSTRYTTVTAKETIVTVEIIKVILIMRKYTCGTVALMVLGQFSDICGPSENWPMSMTIRATVPQIIPG